MKNSYLPDAEVAQIIADVCSSDSRCLDPLVQFEKEMRAETPLVDSLSAQQDKHFKQRLNLSSKATPAMKLLCAIGDWTCNNKSTLVSRLAYNQAAYGYKNFAQVFNEKDLVSMVLRVSEFDVVELQSVIAYPDGKGNGSMVLKKLCDVADEFKVILWLDAYPYGADQKQIPLAKLKEVYRRFEFIDNFQINPEWVCGFHKIHYPSFRDPMIRMPRE